MMKKSYTTIVKYKNDSADIDKNYIKMEKSQEKKSMETTRV